MRVAILETGEPPAALKPASGGYPAMFERLLRPLAPGLSAAPVRVFAGETPPPLSEIDAVLVTGSPAGVYEGHAWIAPTAAYLREAATAGRPQVGICFGHQLMAQAFGGRVEKSARGWGVGVHTYEVSSDAPFLSPPSRRIACVVSHQDQVVERPPGAQVLAGSSFCPNGALAYAQGPAISFQMHPEFDHDFARALLNHRRESMPAGTVDDALASYGRDTDRGLIARWIANFLLMKGAPR